MPSCARRGGHGPHKRKRKPGRGSRTVAARGTPPDAAGRDGVKCGLEPRNAGDARAREGRGGGFSLGAPGEGAASRSTGHTFLSSLSLWSCVTAAAGDRYRGVHLGFARGRRALQSVRWVLTPDPWGVGRPRLRVLSVPAVAAVAGLCGSHHV